MTDYRYTTERGIEIGVVPIPMLLDEIRKAHPTPARPTYTETLAGGATNVIEIDDETAEAWAKHDPETWAAHAEAWAAYLAERNERDALVNRLILDAAILRAVEVDLPADDGWIEDQQALGLTVPAQPRARRLHYIRTEVIGGIRDVIQITNMANGSASLSEEVLSLVEASFRSSLARNLLRGLADRERSMEPGAEGGPDAGGESVGAEAK